MPDRRRAESRLAAIADALGGESGVTVGSDKRGFGSDALQVDGRIFAMVAHDCLVFKMPRGRVAELIDKGDAVAFDAGKGRPMKEWVAFEIAPNTARSIALAREARSFVAAGSRSPSLSPVAAVDRSAAQKLFDAIAVEYLAQPSTERRRMFGADGLRSNGSYFAFLSKDRLVVKVPAESAQKLIAKGLATTAESVSPAMRQWIAVPYAATTAGRTRWRRLVAESHDTIRASTDATAEPKVKPRPARRSPPRRAS